MNSLHPAKTKAKKNSLPFRTRERDENDEMLVKFIYYQFPNLGIPTIAINRRKLHGRVLINSNDSHECKDAMRLI